MRAIFAIVPILFMTINVYADDGILDSAIQNAQQKCIGIADEFNHMKTMAGINTAVTGVGTAAGIGAAVVGFSKAEIDKELDALSRELCGAGYCDPNTIENMSDEDFFYDVLPTMEQMAKLVELQDKSKNLGNWRTGLMAGSTATNIAGAIIAGNNKAKTDLRGAIDDCIAATAALRDARMQERVSNPQADLTAVDTIISACGAWQYVDLSKINNRANGAMWSSVAGATLGAAGTVTSAVANSNGVRTDASEDGRKKEKNLNTASNVLAVGTSVASATATVFNATQISAIKQASNVADECERTLNNQ
ncbi:MAG: hypothetical protein NC311_04515 [Muribaculaceae bacterium]|nr:hypothetical protein [Muribaculaceae bacterium]